MPWDDDFLDELEGTTGLSPDELVEVIQRLDPNYAAERARLERAAAVEKARVLLLQHLDDEQRAEFEEHRHFHVISSAGRRFQIRLGRESNVSLVNEQGGISRTFCIHVRDQVPDEDNVLAQMLLLRANEEDFLRIARG